MSAVCSLFIPAIISCFSQLTSSCFPPRVVPPLSLHHILSKRQSISCPVCLLPAHKTMGLHLPIFTSGALRHFFSNADGWPKKLFWYCSLNLNWNRNLNKKTKLFRKKQHKQMCDTSLGWFRTSVVWDSFQSILGNWVNSQINILCLHATPLSCHDSLTFCQCLPRCSPLHTQEHIHRCFQGKQHMLYKRKWSVSFSGAFPVNKTFTGN